jgi:quercetin dioxygenase-like cupin family protein
VSGPTRRAPWNWRRSKGVITIEVSEQPVTLGAGDAVTLAGDVAHSYANPGTGPARYARHRS